MLRLWAPQTFAWVGLPGGRGWRGESTYCLHCSTRFNSLLAFDFVFQDSPPLFWCESLGLWSGCLHTATISPIHWVRVSQPGMSCQHLLMAGVIEIKLSLGKMKVTLIGTLILSETETLLDFCWKFQSYSILIFCFICFLSGWGCQIILKSRKTSIAKPTSSLQRFSFHYETVQISKVWHSN